jgi:hypothetical protein
MHERMHARPAPRPSQHAGLQPMPAVELHQAAQQVFLGVPRIAGASSQWGGVAIQANTVVTTPCTIVGIWLSGSHVSRVFPCAQQLPTIRAASASGARIAANAVYLDIGMRLSETHSSAAAWTWRACCRHRYAAVSNWGCTLRHNAEQQCSRGFLAVQEPPFYWTAAHLCKQSRESQKATISVPSGFR